MSITEADRGTLLTLLYNEVKTREALQTRVDVLEHFIKMQFPEHFAGEANTIADPELKPIEIIYGEPEERINHVGEWSK